MPPLGQASVEAHGQKLATYLSHHQDLTDTPTRVNVDYSRQRVVVHLHGRCIPCGARNCADRGYAAKDTPVRDSYLAAEAMAMPRGEAWGRAQELVLIFENFGAYAHEVKRADGRDREQRARIAAALGACTQSLQTKPGWSAQCIRTGNIMNCSGQ
jgi:hypothetical protein